MQFTTQKYVGIEFKIFFFFMTIVGSKNPVRLISIKNQSRLPYFRASGVHLFLKLSQRDAAFA